MAILIGIAGPSGAGKSTFCRDVLAAFPQVGRLKFDDYFVDEVDVERHPMGYAYWDHPQSIKWPILVEACRGLKMGQAVRVPHYERAENRMTGWKIVEPKPVMLVDGYQVLLEPVLRELLDASLYFDVEEMPQVERRIARQGDVDRGYLYHVMLPAARAFLYPTKRFATRVIDAGRPYEEVREEAMEAMREWVGE